MKMREWDIDRQALKVGASNVFGNPASYAAMAIIKQKNPLEKMPLNVLVLSEGNRLSRSAAAADCATKMYKNAAEKVYTGGPPFPLLHDVRVLERELKINLSMIAFVLTGCCCIV